MEEVVKEAQDRLGMYGKKTILFIDEIHRFNKGQQDYLLPFVEDGTIILIGATTENPYFEVNGALLSRSIIFELKPLSNENIRTLILRAVNDCDKGMGNYGAVIDDDALEFLADMAGGDARSALNAVELGILTTPKSKDGSIHLTLDVASECIQKRVIKYDKKGDNHYDIISAFIKSMRGSDPDAAVYYLAKMLYAGEDVKFIARRIMILASEDIGNADPQALQVAVAAAQAAQTAASDVPEFVEEKLPNIRKVIAKSMHKSLSEMAQLTLNTSFDATEISAFRAKVKENKDALGFANITLNDIILFAVAKTLPAFRELNAHFYDDKMVFFNHVNLGIAVDTPRGLMVPTVFKAETLSLNDLSKAAKAVITDAQNGSINPDLLTGGSFTVTNLGAMGIESFTPVINPPQTGILGVDTITTKVKVVNGQLVPYKAMGLSLTFDHRALDGAPAAKFLQALCKNLENFSLLLAK